MPLKPGDSVLAWRLGKPTPATYLGWSDKNGYRVQFTDDGKQATVANVTPVQGQKKET